MGMGFGFVLLIILLMVWAFKTIFIGDPDSELYKIRQENKTLDFYYFGGFDEISVKQTPVGVMVINDKNLQFKFHREGNGDVVANKTVENKDIKNVRFMNETSIVQQISLGKMVCFGWLSLAMKNNKKVVNEYVVIDILDKGENKSIVLDFMFWQNINALKEMQRIIDLNLKSALN